MAASFLTAADGFRTSSLQVRKVPQEGRDSLFTQRPVCTESPPLFPIQCSHNSKEPSCLHPSALGCLSGNVFTESVTDVVADVAAPEDPVAEVGADLVGPGRLFFFESLISK